MGQIEQRLVAVLKKQRREAIGYSVLTVLCTPFFVALIGLAVMIMIAFIFSDARYDMDARAFYACTSLFLATMAGFVYRGPGLSGGTRMFDISWLAGVAILLLLVYATFAKSFIETAPRAFAVFYTVAGFLILALFGRVYMKMPIGHDGGDEDLHRSLPLFIFGLVAMAYGEIASSSWLWFAPDDDEIKVAAWILRKLAGDDDGRLDLRCADTRILSLLFRLKFIQVRDGMLELTYDGYHFVAAAEDYAVE
jgi:hypothetical protein